MSRRSRKSKRRLNSLLWMLLLTAMLVVSSTYAWFSANKVVTIDGIFAKVSAAEGLQISLDGENWVSNITLNKDTLDDVGSTINNYNWPTELRPVSTDGHQASGDVVMYAGEVSSDGSYLTGAAQNSTDYIAFDLYFKNASSQEDGDNLQLNTGTMIQVTNPDLQLITGLENSARVGMLVYDSQALMTAAAADVRALGYGTAPQTSIWEPNYNVHIPEIKANDSLRVPTVDAEFITLGLKSITESDKTIGGATVTAVHDINAVEVGTNTNLAQQITMQTDASIGAPMNMTDTNGEDIILPQNSIVKTRVYIWLEGQDPDCIDTASTGQELEFKLSFTKPSVDTSGTP